MRYGGITEDDALKTITYNGAMQLGVQDRVGSIEVGKDADVVIWNGIRSASTRARKRHSSTVRSSSTSKKDLAMRDQMAKERAALEAAERGRRSMTCHPEGAKRLKELLSSLRNQPRSMDNRFFARSE